MKSTQETRFVYKIFTIFIIHQDTSTHDNDDEQYRLVYKKTQQQPFFPYSFVVPSWLHEESSVFTFNVNTIIATIVEVSS